jgi:uncharacterized protein (TIGR03435 family)
MCSLRFPVREHASRAAQVPAGPAFEVASIKPDTSGPRGISNIFLSGGRYVGSATTVRGMIRLAYQPLLDRQIVGGPAWLDSERYEIQAKANGARQLTRFD